MVFSKNILYRGSDETLPEVIPLRAGSLEMLYDQGDLRAIRFGGQELLRRIYVAVRDRNWGTIPARLAHVGLHIEENAFTIDYDVENRQADIDFSWHGALRGTPDGRISFAMDGAARTTFWKNRIGFCVLLPVGMAGQRLRIEHTGGMQEQALLPVDISADQPVRPFESIRALALPLDPAGEAAIRFEGDAFEMEDQRLWTDASYKVFCTPLALPYPVEIQAGGRVSQQIELAVRSVDTASTPAPKAAHPASAPVTLRLPLDMAWKAMPPLGLGMASHEQALIAGEVERLKGLHLRHLRVDLPLAQPGWQQRLERAVSESAALGIGLEMALLVGAEQAESELDSLRAELDRLRPPVCRWLAYPARENYAGGSPTGLVLRAARQLLQDYAPSVPFIAGTNTDFIFLKRTPPPVEIMDGVCITLNPQVHAFDDRSLVETLEAQPMVVESARRLAGGLPVVVSPITLKPRFNAYATGPAAQDAEGALPPQVDPRQLSLFGAGWTLGSLRAMVASGAASLTYYETTGWRGVMELEAGSPLPQAFPSLPGSAFPLYHVLADYGEFSNGEAMPLLSSAPQRVCGLALRQGGWACLLLANHTAEAQAVSIAGLDGPWNGRWLDERNAEDAMRAPDRYRRQFEEIASPDVTLLPYGLLRLERFE